MATLSFVDVNGSNVSATLTFESGGTNLRLSGTYSNGKSFERNLRFSIPMTMMDALQRAGMYIDNFYKAEASN